MAAVALDYRHDPLAVRFDYFARAVGRTVIDDDHFEVRIGLRERAVDSIRAGSGRNCSW